MIQWGEERRNKDPSFFCRLATEGAEHPVWIISDARRTTDLQYFRSQYPQCIAVRIQADEAVRVERGFAFTPGMCIVCSCCGERGGFEFTKKKKKVFPGSFE